MARDAAEAPLLIAFLFLPVVMGALALRRGSLLAQIPLGIFAAQIGLWFGYYATDWFWSSNPGMAGVWAHFILPTMVSVFVAAAALRTANHRP